MGAEHLDLAERGERAGRVPGRGGGDDRPGRLDDRPHGTELLILAPVPAGTADGLVLLAALRMRPDLADVPAILLVVDSTDKQRDRARALNAHLLARPLRPSRLRALMNRLLGAHDGDGAQGSGIG